MRRSKALWFLALFAALPSLAHAEALAPALCATIPQLELRPQNSLFTAGEAPDHVFYVLRNPHAVERTVRLRALVLRRGTAIVGLNPTRIVNADTGAALGRDLTLRPNTTLRIEVHFDAPSRGEAFPIEATFDQQGCRQRVVSEVHRGTRHPMR